MTVSFGEEPNVARSEIVLCGLAIWRDHRCAHISLYHVGPLAGDRVPVQFTESARFQAHGNAGNTGRYRQLLNGRFLRRPALADPTFTSLQVMLKMFERFVLFSWLGRRLGFGTPPPSPVHSTASHSGQASPLSPPNPP